MEISERPQSLSIELLARAAVQTSAIRISADCERTTEFFMPAAENLSEQADFAAENLFSPIDGRVRYSILL